MGSNITIRDVAKEAGVAIGTASRVLNGHKSVSEDVRKRVLKAVKKLRYEPDRPGAAGFAVDRIDQARILRPGSPQCPGRRLKKSASIWKRFIDIEIALL